MAATVALVASFVTIARFPLAVRGGDILFSVSTFAAAAALIAHWYDQAAKWRDSVWRRVGIGIATYLMLAASVIGVHFPLPVEWYLPGLLIAGLTSVLTSLIGGGRMATVRK